MSETGAVSKAAQPTRSGRKTPFAHLIRHVPFGDYYARLRVKGKPIRRSLNADPGVFGFDAPTGWSSTFRLFSTEYEIRIAVCATVQDLAKRVGTLNA